MTAFGIRATFLDFADDPWRRVARYGHLVADDLDAVVNARRSARVRLDVAVQESARTAKQRRARRGRQGADRL